MPVYVEAKAQFLESIEADKLTKDTPPASHIDGLDLSYNYLTTLSGLAPFCRLLRLDVSHNHIDELQQLAHTITSLNAAYNRLSSLSGIEELRALTELDVSYNSLSDTREISLLMHLTTLKLAGNKIRAVEGLERLQRLKHLDLRNNLIVSPESLAPLSQNARLSTLQLSGNPLSRVRGWKQEVLQIAVTLDFLDGERLERRPNRPPSPVRRVVPPLPPPEQVTVSSQSGIGSAAPSRATISASPVRQPLNDGRWPFLSPSPTRAGAVSLSSFDVASDTGHRPARSPSPPRSLASVPSIASTSRLLALRSASPSKEDLRAAALTLKKELGLSPPRSARKMGSESNLFLASTALEPASSASSAAGGTLRSGTPPASLSRARELWDPLDPDAALAASAADFDLRLSRERASGRPQEGHTSLGPHWEELAPPVRPPSPIPNRPSSRIGFVPDLPSPEHEHDEGDYPLDRARSPLQAVSEGSERGSTPPRPRIVWTPPAPPPAPVLSSAYAAAYRSPSPPPPYPSSRPHSARERCPQSSPPARPRSWAVRLAADHAGAIPRPTAAFSGPDRGLQPPFASRRPRRRPPGSNRPPPALSSSLRVPVVRNAVPPSTRSLSPQRAGRSPPASWSRLFASAHRPPAPPAAPPPPAPQPNDSFGAWDAGDSPQSAASDGLHSPPRSAPSSPARAPASAPPAAAHAPSSPAPRRQPRRSAEVVVWSATALEGLAQLLRSSQVPVRNKALLVFAGVLDSDENARHALALDVGPAFADLLRSPEPSAVADTCHCISRLAAVWEPAASPNGPALLALSYPLLTVAAGSDSALQEAAVAALESLAAKGLTSESRPPPSPSGPRGEAPPTDPEVARRLEFRREEGGTAELDESGQGEALLRRKRSNRIVQQILHPDPGTSAHELSLAELADRPLEDLSPDWRTPPPPSPPPLPAEGGPMEVDAGAEAS